MRGVNMLETESNQLYVSAPTLKKGGAVGGGGFLTIVAMRGVNMLETESNQLYVSTPTLKKGVAVGGGISSYNPTLKPASRKLRNNMTAAEATIWKRLRKDQLGVRFYRQKPILDYIVDFYCPALKLVVEVDGGYHETPEQAQKDTIRDAQLHKLGLTVLRVSNEQVLEQINTVLARITGCIR